MSATIDYTAEAPSREYLRLLVRVQRMAANCPDPSPAEWLLRNGMSFTRGPRPKGIRKGPDRFCFWNSLRLAERRSGRYVYCEGYATAIIPVEHAWVYDRRTGLIVETTWDDEGNGRDYFGVPVKTSYARRCLLRERPVVMDWKNDFPVVNGRVPESEWKETL